MTNEEIINSLYEIKNWKCNGDSKMHSIICEAINLLEQTRWIPVSERLPEIHQDVLLSLRSLDVLDGFRAGTEPYFYCQGDYVEPQNVLAWMPLPEEPYKAESEDKE